jgi:four helix bundle protein
MLELAHTKLEVFKISMMLVKEVYKLTGKLPDSEKFSLSSQLRRAAISICSNISEGCSRSSYAERRRFFEIARSSLVDVDCQIEIVKSLNYLDPGDLEKIHALSTSVFRLLSKMIRQLL